MGYLWSFLNELWVYRLRLKEGSGVIYNWWGNSWCLQHNFYNVDPKDDNPSSFKKFRPTSICNYIHKIISKLVERTIKKILSRQIFDDQFGFMEGQKIHKVVGFLKKVYIISRLKISNWWWFKWIYPKLTIGWVG